MVAEEEGRRGQKFRTLVSECVGSLVSECVGTLVTERIEDTSVKDKIEDTGVRAC